MTTYPTKKRRGNAIVLAASILVLLVIVATTFVSRTQTARKTASAVQRSSAANTSFDVTSLFLAQTVSDALFVRLIDAHYDPILGEDSDLTFNLPRADWSSQFSSQGVAAPAVLVVRRNCSPLAHRSRDRRWTLYKSTRSSVAEFRTGRTCQPKPTENSSDKGWTFV